MHELIINSNDLREAIQAFQPFASFERNQRLSRSDFYAPIWEDKVRIDIIADDLIARITYDAKHYKLTTNIHCDSNDDVRFFLNINDLMSILEKVEDEDILMQEFYLGNSVCDIMADLRSMKATVGHDDFGYDFIVGKESIGSLQAYFATEPFSTPSSKYYREPTIQYKNFSGKFLAETLNDFVGFTSSFIEINQKYSFVWYSIENNSCTIKATDSHVLKAKSINTPQALEKGDFGILGEIAELVASFVDNKPVVLTFGNSYCTIYADCIFLEMAYNRVDKIPPFDMVLKKFIPVSQIIFKKDELSRFVDDMESKSPRPIFIDIHRVGKYTYLQCLNQKDSSEFDGDVFENENSGSDVRLRISLYNLKLALSKARTNQIAIESNGKHLYNIADLSEPFSEDNAQLFCGAVFDDELKQLEENENLMRLERGIKKPKEEISGVETFVIGEKFTRHPVPFDGNDRLIPIITSTGVDVVLSLADVSVEEFYAISEAPLTLGVFEMNSVPFIILNFNDTMVQEFALNVMTMSEFERRLWINQQDKNLLRIFHVDASTGELVSIRLHNPEMMSHIKNICKSQCKYSAETIDNFIVQTENVMTVREMNEYAQQTEILKIELG